MNYDFDNIVERRGTNCVKWDEAPQGVLPMWVADMDFETAPCVRKAIENRAAHGVYAYNLVPESFYESIIWWNSHRHNWLIERDSLLYTSGVVPAVSAIIKALCPKGEAVLFFTPAYNCFFSSVRNNGCRSVEFPLTWDSESEKYTVDFELLEKTMGEERPKVLLFCNPHNPSGRVWTREELIQIAQICKRYSVIVLSDEIHCEFVDPSLGRSYIPFANVALEVGCEWVVANAPNKAFNTAGLMAAYIVAPDEQMRQAIDKAININEVCDINCFSFVALEAAYSVEGERWLDQLVEYIFENYRFFRTELKAEFPQLPIAHLEGTYLAWVDVRAFKASSQVIADRLKQDFGVWINAGEMYGQEGFMRINLATQRERLAEGIRRIIQGLHAFL